MNKRINIRPTTSVYATYKNISYKPWSAICEFVDNSTQSFYDNKSKLEEIKYWKKLTVDIQYLTNDPEYGECLIIEDNAFGMNYQDFQRAIVLDSPPKQSSRSEFGMGLKTSACWFGKKWSVETAELGSGVRYKASIDVEQLKKYKNEEIEVEESNCKKSEHGTKIIIWDLNRQIRGRSVGKTKAQLTGIYRNDLRTGEIEIIYNGESLEYVEPRILVESLADGKEITWKQELNFCISFNDIEYRVTGFAALREKGSTAEAGFTLLRRGRAIVGGYENNYRPKEIFGSGNSFTYQRLFGELCLDNWPVTQTKDQFDWYGGLEDELIHELKTRLREMIDKADNFRKQTKPTVNNSLESAVKNLIDARIINDVEIERPTSSKEESSEPIITGNNSEESKDQFEQRNDESSTYYLRFNFKHSDYVVHFSANLEDTKDAWLEITHDGNDLNTYNVEWNLGHSFFIRYIEDEDFIETMGGFILAMVLCEIDGYSVSNNGQVDVNFIRAGMNKMLREIMEGSTNEDGI